MTGGGAVHHVPVLLKPLVDLMQIRPDGLYVDCTGGGGGHASAVLEKLGESGRLIVLDRDTDAVERLTQKFAGDSRVTVVHANFRDTDQVLAQLGIETVDGLYADFGVSTFQLKTGERGFSFILDGPLDMRMDKTGGISAADVVNSYSGDTLINILRKYGEEPMAKRIVEHILQRRVLKRFETTGDLAEVIKNAVPKKFHKKGIHPATQSFQAIRIFVNAELEAIERLVGTVEKYVRVGGRVATISFHSLEDRLVKDIFTRYAKECVCPPGLPACVCGKKASFRLITRKPVVADEAELAVNPYARSAKMRVCERV